jgi:hypothetical protein
MGKKVSPIFSIPHRYTFVNNFRIRAYSIYVAHFTNYLYTFYNRSMTTSITDGITLGITPGITGSITLSITISRTGYG